VSAQLAIHAIFEPDLRRCQITIAGGLSYPDLPVKRIMDIPKGGAIYTVLIPCAADVGHNIMVAFDQEAAWDYRRSGL
jgi:hypothetical protein